MVKVGFICEGATEKLLIESTAFQDLLIRYKISCIFPVIDAQGNGNLLPHNIEAFRAILTQNGAEKLFVLTDLDEDRCLTLTKDRITVRSDQSIIVAVKKIEAWFLADSKTLSHLCRQHVEFPFPEEDNNPFETIRSILIQYSGRGASTKTLLARRMLQEGFSIENAANHPNCLSAQYLLRSLDLLSR